MATHEGIARALARLRADRPGLGLEKAIDAHWFHWFGRRKFRDRDIETAVLWWIEDTPARTWPTVAQIEAAVEKVERHAKSELEAGPCFWECKNGLVYSEVEEPYKHLALVPCECPLGQAKRAYLRGEKTPAEPVAAEPNQ